MNEMSNPLVSVIIPFYSQAGWLSEAIQSALSQTYENIEIIVVNDGSKEDIGDVLSLFGTKIVYTKKVNGGPGSARNFGINIAKGKYLAFLDSDDIWNKQKLGLQVELMERTNAIWSHTDYTLFDTTGYRKDSNLELTSYSGNIFPRSLLATHIATPTVMIRSDYIKSREDLRFNERMRFGQDYFLWLTLSSEQPLYHLNKPLCRVRGRGTNAAKRARAHIQVRAQIWDELKNSPQKLFKRAKYSFAIILIYRLCKLEHVILEFLESKFNLKMKTIEYISRVLYVIPYLSFKLLYKLQ